MSNFIRCPECGFHIGAYYSFITEARRAMFQEKLDAAGAVDPEKVVFDPSISPVLEPLFDALAIKNKCCRTHLVSHVNFSQMYK